jgi:DNA repair protein RadC
MPVSIIPKPRRAPHGGFVRDNDAPATYNASQVTEDSIINQAKEIVAKRMSRKTKSMTSPTLMKEFLILHFAGQQVETFNVAYLDNQHRLIDIEEIFQGTIDGASVYPREVVKAALCHNAAAVILCHNHPSGNPNPSEADKWITTRLKTALATVDIRTLDHFIVAGDEVTSFADSGLI